MSHGSHNRTSDDFFPNSPIRLSENLNTSGTMPMPQNADFKTHNEADNNNENRTQNNSDDDENQPLTLIAAQLPTTTTPRLVEKLRIKVPSISPNNDSSSSSNSNPSTSKTNNNSMYQDTTGASTKLRRYCTRCRRKFRHTVEFHAHLRMHVTQPSVVLRALSPTNNVAYRDYLRQFKQEEEDSSKEAVEEDIDSNPERILSIRTDMSAHTAAESGSLKLRLKIDTNSRRFSISTDNNNGANNFNAAAVTAITPAQQLSSSSSSSKSSSNRPQSAIRILRANEIKRSPSPPKASESSISRNAEPENVNIKRFKSDPPAGLHFECPSLDGYGLEQFSATNCGADDNNGMLMTATAANNDNANDNAAGADEEIMMNSGEAAQLLRELLENPSITGDMDGDWAGAAGANEFMSIDRLAHICTVCHKNFADAALLHQHLQQTGHDDGDGGGGSSSSGNGHSAALIPMEW